MITNEDKDDNENNIDVEVEQNDNITVHLGNPNKFSCSSYTWVNSIFLRKIYIKENIHPIPVVNDPHVEPPK